MTLPERLLQAFIAIEHLTPDTIKLNEKIKIELNNKKKEEFAESERVPSRDLLWLRDQNRDIKNFGDMKYKVYIGLCRINEMVKELRRLYGINLPIFNENYNLTYIASIGVNSKGKYIDDSFFLQQWSFFMKCISEKREFNEVNKKFRLLEQELKESVFRMFVDGVTSTKITEFQNELISKTYVGSATISDEISIKRIRPNGNEDIKFSSFYVKDLEMVYEEIKNGHKGPVYTYLNGQKSNTRKDIDKDFTLQQRILDINNLPLGRWPSENSLRLSTMQQIAVNILNNNESKGTIRSINGPPGTGKTTLLKEVFANIVIDRARELSKFKNPKDGFKYEKKIKLNNNSFNFYRLDNKLKGFSIVVASSNNAAVENISRELPMKSQVMRGSNLENKEYSQITEELDYYREIASLVVNNEDDIKKINKELAWGLFSAPLGKGANINRFFGQLLDTKKANILAKMDGEELNWKQTVDKFLDIIEKVNNQKRILENIINESKILFELEKKVEKLKEIRRLLNKELEILNLETKKPSLSVGRTEEEIKKLTKLKNEEEKIRNKVKKIDIEIKQIEAKRKEYDELIEQKAPSLSIPDKDYWEIKNNDFRQCTVPYLEDRLNHLRALCFLYALKVHKAFHQHNKYIIKNHLQLLNSRKELNINTDADILPDLWETLHLIVPVVSTTFSSLSNMYKGMKEGEIGYLFIDEAGQAVPQAAVGGIWRAR